MTLLDQPLVVSGKQHKFFVVNELSITVVNKVCANDAPPQQTNNHTANASNT